MLQLQLQLPRQRSTKRNCNACLKNERPLQKKCGQCECEEPPSAAGYHQHCRARCFRMPCNMGRIYIDQEKGQGRTAWLGSIWLEDCATIGFSKHEASRLETAGVQKRRLYVRAADARRPAHRRRHSNESRRSKMVLWNWHHLTSWKWQGLKTDDDGLFAYNVAFNTIKLRCT